MKLAPNEVYGDMTILKRFHTVIPLSCSQVKRVATVWKGRNLCFLMFWKLFFGSKIGSKLEEGYKQQGCILSPYLFNSYEEYITHNAGLDESQVGIKTARRNINSIRYADTTLMAESDEELKRLLMRVKEKSEGDGLKPNIQKTKITASSPITRWQIDGGKNETMADFIFLGSKVTENNDCSREIKRHLLLGRKVMTHLDNVLKGGNITLTTKVCLLKALNFPVAVYGCES